jgi:spermidine export protein MdtJ
MSKISKGWIFMSITIFAEVLGVICMMLSAQTGYMSLYLTMYVLIGISYYFLAQAIKTIPLGIAYAVWEGVGVSLIALAGYFLFKEALNLQHGVGIGLALLGIVLLNVGETNEH